MSGLLVVSPVWFLRWGLTPARNFAVGPGWKSPGLPFPQGGTNPPPEGAPLHVTRQLNVARPQPTGLKDYNGDSICDLLYSRWGDTGRAAPACTRFWRSTFGPHRSYSSA